MIYLFSYDCGLVAYPEAQNTNNTIQRYWHYFYNDGKVYQANTQWIPTVYSAYTVGETTNDVFYHKSEKFDYELPEVLHLENIFDYGTDSNNHVLCKLFKKHIFRIISDSI
jgi:hypothetical protein